jgi:hypothetical protein
MKIAFIAMALVAAAPLVHADGNGNGEHPAIVARRVIAAQGYDYASAFYLHPAGLSLATRPSGPMKDQPDALLARRNGADHPAAPRAVSRR